MISFKEFIKESNLTLEDIIKECTPFLKESKGELIYRGVNHPHNKISVESPLGELTIYREITRMDRRPMDNKSLRHNVVDQWMYDKFGIRGRSQTIFTIGKYDRSLLYGETYIVLPRGDFKFLWSPEVDDLVYWLRRTVGYELQLTPDMNEVEQTDLIKKYLANSEYQVTDLPLAIKSGHEIMISCKDYYLIPFTDENVNLIKGML